MTPASTLAASPRAADIPAAAPRDGTAAAWRFHVLTEIANYPLLRRQLGIAGASRVAGIAADVLRQALPDAQVAILGAALLEVVATAEQREQVDAVLGAIRLTLAEPIAIDGETCRIALHLGASRSAGACDDFALIEGAEAALEEARAAGHVVVREANGHDTDRMTLIAELSDAIDRDELVLHYQPKVHARRQEIDSAEALIRWQHPVRGMIPPGDFIPAAEAGHLIDRLTLWTIERAIADQRVLRDAGYDLRIFINISGQLLGDPAFAARASQLVAESDATLGFEVTETSVIRDPASAIANLQRFADIGLRIAIDDYGAGLSSLAYLKQLPARELKIDKLFVTQLTSSNRDPLIVRSTIDLAHALDMEVVAEGVETHAALALLTVMGCDMIQGFLISRPIPRDSLIKFLAEDSNHRASTDTRASFSRLARAWKRG